MGHAARSMFPQNAYMFNRAVLTIAVVTVTVTITTARPDARVLPVRCVSILIPSAL